MGMNNYSLGWKSLIDLTKLGGNARHTRNRHRQQSVARLSIGTRSTENAGNRQGDHEKPSGQSAVRFNIEQARRTQESHKIKKRSGVPPTQQKYVHRHFLMTRCIKGT